MPRSGAELGDPVWPHQGEWTYEDYLRLPDDGKRYEIVDGVLYVTNAPDYDRQFAVSELHLRIGAHLKDRKPGVVLTSPFEIHLPGIAKPVQPDVRFIAAGRGLRAGAKFFEGAPDLIVEVISLSSVRLDRVVKFTGYERAGVREYWLADPRLRFVEVYTIPADGTEYVLLGQFRLGELVRSSVWLELAIPVDTLFLSPESANS